MVSLVPTTDGQAQTRRQIDLFFPDTIRPERYEYRLIANDRQNGLVDLSGAVGGEFYYEDLQGEISQRLVARIDNRKRYNGKFPSELLAMPTPVEVHVDWGAGFQRVFIGQVSTEINADTNFEFIANDPMKRFLQSDATLVLAAGEDTADGLAYLATKFELPIVTGTDFPHVEGGLTAFIARGDKVAAIYAALFEAHDGLTGERWLARYNPRATGVSPLGPTQGGLEYVARGRPHTQVFMLTEDHIVDRPYSKRTIDNLVTEVQIIAPPSSSGERSETSTKEIPIEVVYDKRPGNARSQFGRYIRILYLETAAGERSEDDSGIKQRKAQAMMLLNDFGQPEEERRIEAPDLPWLRVWDRVYARYNPLGDVYAVSSVTHDCLTGRMRADLEPNIRNLIFPRQWLIPDGEPPVFKDDPLNLGSGLFWPYAGQPNLHGGYDWNGDGGRHKGVDLYGGSQYAPIHASSAGHINHVEFRSRGQNDNPDGSGYGNWIEIDHGTNSAGDRVKTRYAHCSDVLVAEGEEITAGFTIALQGNTGTTAPAGSGYHCHFELRFDDVPVNPHEWMRVWSVNVP